MASISVDYTFTNATTADASQINTNFTNIINGTSDGTKDFSISALTVGGTLTANGNVNLGNASSDDLSITASLASSLAIKTTATYNIGSSTLGLLSAYLGNSTFTTRLLSGASASWSFTFPTTAGTAGYALVTNGSGVTSWSKEHIGTATNDSATAGYIGEVVTGSLVRSSATSLTTGTAKTITSISLTAGDWSISGCIGHLTGTGTSITLITANVSLTTNATGSSDLFAVPASNEIAIAQYMPATLIGNSKDIMVQIPTYRVTLSATTTLYLVAQAIFTVSTLTGYGYIQARRVR